MRTTRLLVSAHIVIMACLEVIKVYSFPAVHIIISLNDKLGHCMNCDLYLLEPLLSGDLIPKMDKWVVFLILAAANTCHTWYNTLSKFITLVKLYLRLNVITTLMKLQILNGGCLIPSD